MENSTEIMENLTEKMETIIEIGHNPLQVKNLSNCICIGENAGINITEGDGIVIIGDNILDLNPEGAKNVLFLGNKIAIGETICGVPINLKSVIEELFVKRHGEEIQG